MDVPWMFRGAQKCGKVGNIVSKWKLCDTRGNRATRAGLSIARVRSPMSRRKRAMRGASLSSGVQE